MPLAPLAVFLALLFYLINTIYTKFHNPGSSAVCPNQPGNVFSWFKPLSKSSEATSLRKTKRNRQNGYHHFLVCKTIILKNSSLESSPWIQLGDCRTNSRCVNSSSVQYVSVYMIQSQPAHSKTWKMDKLYPEKHCIPTLRSENCLAWSGTIYQKNKIVLTPISVFLYTVDCSPNTFVLKKKIITPISAS